MNENKISAVFNSLNKEWEVNHEGIYPDSCIIAIRVLSNDNDVDYSKITYGFKFYVENELVERNEYPKIRAKIDMISSSYEVQPPVYLYQNKSHKLHLWMRINEDTYEKDVILENIIPKQPYDSWTFIDGDWHPPIPRPDEGITMWDEEKQEWINLDHEYMPGAAGSLIKE